MRSMTHRAAAFALVLMGAAPAAAQEELVTDISQHLISIQSNFTGAQLLLFGAVGGDATAERDIVIVVRGPDMPVTVRRKERIGGIWINYGSADFETMPGYYAVVSTRPLSAIAPAAVLQRYGIGTRHLNLRPTGDAATRPKDIKTFADAAIRIKSANALYREQPGDVLFLGSSLFRASIDMPANVPDGLYTARIYLFRDGSVAQAQTSTLFVNKAGFERLVYDFAQNEPLAYGIGVVIIGWFAGWAASAVFRGR